MAYGATREAWIVGAVRTPVGKQGGALSAVRPDDLGALVLEALRMNGDWLTREEIRMRCIGISAPSIYRYLKHLMGIGWVEEETCELGFGQREKRYRFREPSEGE